MYTPIPEDLLNHELSRPAKPPKDLSEIDRSFSYDGVWLRWKRATAKRGIGAIAGGLDKRLNQWVITSRSRTVPAVYLVWYLIHGTWPDHQLTTMDGDPRNLRLDNIIRMRRKTDPDDYYDDDARLAVMLKQRKRRTRRRLDSYYVAQQAALATNLPGAGIYYRKARQHEDSEGDNAPLANGHWVVTAAARRGMAPTDDDGPGGLTDQNHQLLRTESFEEAIAFYHALQTGYRYILDNPNPLDNRPDLRNWASERFATNATVRAWTSSLADVLDAFAYDPDTGIFYHRSGGPSGVRADTSAKRSKVRQLQLRGRVYQASMIAWFLMTHEWPGRRAIRHIDGDPANNCIDNLEKIDR